MDGLAPFPREWQRALVVAAHPDDIEWGVSSAVAAWTAAGHTVQYLLVTRGEAGVAGQDPTRVGPMREAEQRVAGRAVGVTDVEFLDFADGRVVEDLALRRAIAGHVRSSRPDLVVAMNHNERWGGGPGANWNSADHRAVGRATIDAVYDAANEWIFPELAQVPLEQGARHIAIASSAQPTHVVDVGDPEMERARASLVAHRRYLEGLGVQDVSDYAAEVVASATTLADGARGVAFELLGGPGE